MTKNSDGVVMFRHFILNNDLKLALICVKVGLYSYLNTSPRHEMNKPNLRVFNRCTENVKEIKIGKLDINISSNT